MIHDIFPHRFSNRYIPDAVMGEEDMLFHFKENTLLLKIEDDNVELPKKKDFPELDETAEATFLFSLNDVNCFLLHNEPAHRLPDFGYREIGFFRTIARRETAWVSLAGYQLANWYGQNNFCGRCGSAMQKSNRERALFCAGCNTSVYPKISPAIIVAILSGDKILLARNAGFRGSWFSLIAGYADVGESLEQTVLREVKEEVGLDVKNIRYYKSQPWPLSGSMMIGFIAEADEQQPIQIDDMEITEAGWFTRDNLPDHPSTLSIAGEMIAKFREGKLV